MKRILLFVFVIEPLAELFLAWLRFCDNRRKYKPLTEPWATIWARFIYEEVSGYGRGECAHWYDK